MGVKVKTALYYLGDCFLTLFYFMGWVMSIVVILTIGLYCECYDKIRWFKELRKYDLTLWGRVKATFIPIWIHNLMFDITDVFKEILKIIFDLTFGRAILRDASKHIAVSNMEKEQLKEKGIPGDKIIVISNGVSID